LLSRLQISDKPGKNRKSEVDTTDDTLDSWEDIDVTAQVC